MSRDRERTFGYFQVSCLKNLTKSKCPLSPISSFTITSAYKLSMSILLVFNSASAAALASAVENKKLKDELKTSRIQVLRELRYRTR